MNGHRLNNIYNFLKLNKLKGWLSFSILIPNLQTLIV